MLNLVKVGKGDLMIMTKGKLQNYMMLDTPIVKLPQNCMKIVTGLQIISGNISMVDSGLVKNF